MKSKLYLVVFIVFLTACSSQKNSEKFIKSATGRYLFNANEVLEIYFKEQQLLVKWRGNEDIQPLKVNDSSFYMKELNEKMMFVHHPKMHIALTPKREHKGVVYHFRKMTSDEKTPNEYFKAKEFDKALAAFQLIQKKDSLNPIIDPDILNSLGYDFLRENNFETAIAVFKINVTLYPKSANTYDSLGEGYLRNKDTVNAIINYEKSLDLNFDNRHAERILRKISN